MCFKQAQDGNTKYLNIAKCNKLLVLTTYQVAIKSKPAMLIPAQQETGQGHHAWSKGKEEGGLEKSLGL